MGTADTNPSNSWASEFGITNLAEESFFYRRLHFAVVAESRVPVQVAVEIGDGALNGVEIGSDLAGANGPHDTRTARTTHLWPYRQVVWL